MNDESPNGSRATLRPSPPRKNRPAWEERRRLGTATAFARTIREVALEPGATFPLVRRSGSALAPIGFGLIAVPLFEAVADGLRGGWSLRLAGEACARGAALHLAATLTAALAATLLVAAAGIGARPGIDAGRPRASLARRFRAAVRLAAYSFAATAVAIPLPLGRWVHLVWWCAAMAAGAPAMLGTTRAKALAATIAFALAGATAGRFAFALLDEIAAAAASRFP